MEVPVNDVKYKGNRVVYITEKRAIEVDEEHSMVTISPTVDTHDEAYAKSIMVLFIDDKESSGKAGLKYTTHKDDDEEVGFSITIRKKEDGTTVELAPAVPKKP